MDGDRELARFDEQLAARLRAEGRCGRPRRGEGKGQLCRQWAGTRTAHPGRGPCWLHGGLKRDGTDKRIRSGVYSTVSDVRVSELVKEIGETVSNPLDVIPELTLARALLVDWTERYAELRDAIIQWNQTREPEDRPGRVPDIQHVGPILERISRIVYRIERATSDKYIPRGQFYRVMTALGRAVDARVVDEAVKKQIVDDWMRIEVP